MADDTPNPLTPSGDHQAQSAYWDMVGAILNGAEAMRATLTYQGSVSGPVTPAASLAQLNRGEGGPESPYLPKFRNETSYDYETRRRHAPFTNIYADIAGNLASKPFAKTLELAEDSATDLIDLSQNIDGQGNSLHVFARETFKRGLDFGIHWILIDFTKVPPGVTLADERGMGARPYWVHIPAERLIAVYSAFVNGAETIYHARIYEPSTEVVGYDEVMVQRVRVLERQPLYGDARDVTKVTGYGNATWELLELVQSTDEAGKVDQVWVSVGSGPITIGIIPLVPFLTGKRHGTCWRVDPPLSGIAYMQVEEFQQESNLKAIKELTAFPMLALIGFPREDSSGAALTVTVGAKTVIVIPPGMDGSSTGDAKYIEPAGSSLTFLQLEIEKLQDQMRTLGMQPLATANLTVVTTANLSSKASSAVQAWAIGLKDALEQAWKITAKWLGRADEEVVVNVHTDFAIELSKDQDVQSLLKCQSQGILSTETTQSELKRRGVLSDDFDPDEEAEKLAKQDEALQGEMMIDPKTGQPIAPKVAGAGGNVVPLRKPQPAGGASKSFKTRLARG